MYKCIHNLYLEFQVSFLLDVSYIFLYFYPFFFTFLEFFYLSILQIIHLFSSIRYPGINLSMEFDIAVKCLPVLELTFYCVIFNIHFSSMIKYSTVFSLLLNISQLFSYLILITVVSGSQVLFCFSVFFNKYMNESNSF